MRYKNKLKYEKMWEKIEKFNKTGCKKLGKSVIIKHMWIKG